MMSVDAVIERPLPPIFETPTKDLDQSSLGYAPLVATLDM
jgi:hypothetical protein